MFFRWQILVPVPQYPLYSATISLLGGSLVPYYLDESENWGLDVNNLRQSVAQARSQGISVSTLFPSSLAIIDAVSIEVYVFFLQLQILLHGYIGKGNGDH